ncbi:RNA polymerase subunit sigma-70 [Mumia sp. Pv 4-285]|uniref:RNA polymerase subunit sigma-70 n=1 Tax=Mumia qirimensis TaxID=3234852 RepID=UPI00351D77CC
MTEFDAGLEQYRSELVAYCYRMVGSANDAEDLVQETLLRAWRAREQYDTARASIRTWLYRIATNVCRTALAGNGRRALPSGLVAPRDPLAPFALETEIPWLQPLPDSAVEATDPAVASAARSSLRLAFVAVLQHLSARQRGTLILRDVLAFSAAETAQILDMTVVAVNSSLQRARSRIREVGRGSEIVEVPTAGEQRLWLERYMAAFVAADVEALKQLLAADVVMEMPPLLNWFRGPHNYGLFMDWVFDANGRDWRLLTVAANGQPAFAAYNRVEGEYRLHTLQVFTVTHAGISRNSVFQDPEIFAAFKLSLTLN